MLDIHPDRPGEFDDDDADDSNNNNNNNNSAREPFEVFEAGTGHGSLTLHLARAIHAANPPLPRTLREAIFAKKPAESGEKDQTQAQQSDDGQVESDTACGSAAEAGDGPPDLEPLTASDAEPAPASSPPTPSKSSFHTIPLLHPSPDLAPVLTEYLASRRAVLHTLDRNASHARHARRLVRQFRRAQYLGDVDFHTGDLAAYLEARLAARHDRPFLDRAVLDLPGPHRPEIAAPLIRALRSGALLAVFTPSVSQLAQFIQAWADPVHSRHRARQQQQQQHQASNAGAEAEAETAAAAAASPPPLLKVERIVELPTSVLLASPSALGVTDAGPGRPWDLRTAVPRELERQRSSASDDATDEAASAGPDELVQIMRPKVGDRVVGGGFVAVLRRRSDSVRPTENGEVQGMVAERQ
jgi:predicted O-methyltransferase YrrM